MEVQRRRQRPVQGLHRGRREARRGRPAVRRRPAGGVHPLPLVLGVGPDGAPPFTGFTKYGAAGGPCLYLSTRATWEAVGVAGSTWYAHDIGSEPTAQPGSAPGLVLTAAARSAPVTPAPMTPAPMTPTEAGLPDPA
ncbi:hypothetical protein ACFYOT_30000 [Saccharothrix saharensis]|uniref:hypothetical protein n=1 Tax=Saccharothrix saharensis TaxID=571190 RepID=UPI003688FE4A